MNWPDQLIEDIARRKCIPLLGAGVSKNAVNDEGKTPPNWKEFLERGYERNGRRPRDIKSYINKGDYLSACEILRREMEEEWVQFLEEQFLRPGYKPSEIHDLGSRLITNSRR